MAKVLGPTPGNLAERVVLRELRRQLPDDWWVVADACWASRTSTENVPSSKYVRDGQADFVVFAPRFGMLIIEVKGSREVRIAEDGRWYRRASEAESWTLVEPSPVAQAMKNAHEIARILARRFRDDAFRHRFGWMVVYPNGVLREGGFHALDSTTMAFKSQMHGLPERIRAALDARGPESRGRDVSPQLAREMAETLASVGVVIGQVDSATDARSDAELIEKLTQQQYAALQGIFRHRRVAVTGPAGSGKTVLALWRLAALVEEGHDALYLCFNKQLAEFLRRRNPGLADHIKHVDSLFATIAPRKSPSTSGGVDAFFREELPGHVIDVASSWSDGQKRSTIIVDEGQDFGEYRLMAVCELLASKANYVYFADGRQDLYHASALSSVGAEVGFLLTHNCRNTNHINATANQVSQDRIPAMPGLPDGEATIVRRCADRSSMAKVAWEIASSWSGAGNRVAVISPYQLDGSCMAGHQKGHGKRLVSTIADWDERDAVLFSTVKSFKGLEADAVILVDVDAKGDLIDRSELYVACTRGRARLAILCLLDSSTAAFRSRK